MKDEPRSVASLRDGIAITYVNFDQLDVETIKIPRVSLRFDQGHEFCITSEERSDNGRADESGGASDYDTVTGFDNGVNAHDTTVEAR
jgi:hypothetical protein